MRLFGWTRPASGWLPRSLRWRLTALMAVFVCLVLVVVAATQYFLLERYLLVRTGTTLRTEARTLIDAHRGQGNPAEAAQQIATELATPELAVVVVGPDGARLAAAGGPGRGAERWRRVMARGELQPLPMAGGEGSYIEHHQTPRRLVVLLPARLGQEGLPATVQLSVPLGGIDSTLRWVLAADLVGLGAMMLLLVAGTAAIVARTLRPLNRLVSVAGSIGEGSLSVRSDLPHDGESETGRLAQAFDSMVARLERLFAAQRQFVADASHELKTPLTAVRGSLDMLLLGMSQSPQETDGLLRGMQRQITRMSRLVNDLLDLTRMESGLQLRRLPVDLAGIAREVLSEAGPVAGEHRLRLEPPSGTQVLVLADPNRVHQVVLSLVDNAIRHTSGGEIVLRVGREGGIAYLSVSDSGPGIPPDELPHLFERFYCGSASRSRSDGAPDGFGLGLAIARGLARAQEGDLTVVSAPGQGSIFTLRLPAAEVAGQGPEASTTLAEVT